ncbi:MAG: aspartate/glutamate racemase family protein [Thermoplasmatales archaeon]|nr:aspartate/glutamate racemase family protein [Thermoplasmatales archaeon]
MKTIGLIGGTTWHSTIEYYRIINETVKEKLGKSHSARCILYSINFEETVVQNQGRWDVISKSFIDITKKLENAGADFLIICANTMHKIADDIENNADIPIIHIADVTAEKIIERGLSKVGLLGTSYTMEENFYKERLKEKFNIETIIPEKNERDLINKIILNELTQGKIIQSSKQRYLEIIENLIDKKAEGIILGCTEIPLLIKKDDVDIPIFDTTEIHAKAAVEYALK